MAISAPPQGGRDESGRHRGKLHAGRRRLDDRIVERKQLSVRRPWHCAESRPRLGARLRSVQVETVRKTLIRKAPPLMPTLTSPHSHSDTSVFSRVPPHEHNHQGPGATNKPSMGSWNLRRRVYMGSVRNLVCQAWHVHSYRQATNPRHSVARCITTSKLIAHL